MIEVEATGRVVLGEDLTRSQAESINKLLGGERPQTELGRVISH